MTNARWVSVPFFPTYRCVHYLLPVLVGRCESEITELQGRLKRLMGSPKNQEDWKDPDVWIPRRLTGNDRDLAFAIWRQTGRHINPRYLKGPWTLIHLYGLLAADATGQLTLTDRGRAFLASGSSNTVALVDEREGLLKVLELIADLGPSRRRDLLPEWEAYLESCSSPVQSSARRERFLGHRLRNLTERGLVVTVGRDYSITPQGGQYVARIRLQASDAARAGRP